MRLRWAAGEREADDQELAQGATGVAPRAGAAGGPDRVGPVTVCAAPDGLVLTLPEKAPIRMRMGLSCERKKACLRNERLGCEQVHTPWIIEVCAGRLRGSSAGFACAADDGAGECGPGESG